VWPGRGQAAPRSRPDQVIADKADSSRANRMYLRRRGIHAVIPEPDDQRANRLRRRGGRSPACDGIAYRERNVVERGINRFFSTGAGWPPATTKPLATTSAHGKPPPPERRPDGVLHLAPDRNYCPASIRTGADRAHRPTHRAIATIPRLERLAAPGPFGTSHLG
jgi:hypothetical protein